MYTAITDSIIDSCSTLLCTINWLLYLLLWVFTSLVLLQNSTGVPFATGTFFFCRDLFLSALSLFSALSAPTVVSQHISGCVPDFVVDPDLFPAPGCSLFAGCDGRIHDSFLNMKDEVVLPVEEVGVIITAVSVVEDDCVDNVGEIHHITQPIVLAEDFSESNEAVETTAPVKSFLDELIGDSDSTMERGVSLGVSSDDISLLSSCSLPDISDSIVAVVDMEEEMSSDDLFSRAFTFDDDMCSFSGDDLVSEVDGNVDISLLSCLSDEDTEMFYCPGSVSKTADKDHSFFGGRCTPTQTRPMGADDSWQATSNMSLCESEFNLGSAEDMDLDSSAFTSSTVVEYSSTGIDKSYSFFGSDSNVEAGAPFADATSRFSLLSRVDSSFDESSAEMEISDEESDNFAFFNRISEYMNTIVDEDELEEGTDSGASLFGGSEPTPFHMVANVPAVKYTRASIFDDDEDDEDDEDED